MKRIKNIELIKRFYTSKSDRRVLAQNLDKIKVHQFPKSKPNKLRIFGWGLAETGALGVQTSLKKYGERQTAIVHHPTRMKFGENCDVTNITCGYGFSAFAVSRSDGETLFGSGINTDSQLGLQEGTPGKPLDLLIYPTAIKLPRRADETDDDIQVRCMSGGRAHLVVVTKNGTIFTLGNNAYGQCGRPIIKEEMYKGSHIVNRIDNVSGSSNIFDDEIDSVECGQDHSLFVTSSGKVYSCGWGADGQTGRGNYNNTGNIDLVSGEINTEKIVKVSSLGDCVLALNDKGEVFGWGNSEYGQLINLEKYPDSPTQLNTPRHLEIVKGLGKIVDIAAGGSFCLVLNENGDVFTWGYGILGFGPYIEQTSTPKRILPQLFGRNDFSPNTKVTSIYCGLFNMGAINSEGDLFMWGKNREGCLGLGHIKDQYFPFKVSINAKVLKVSCGVDHCLALCKSFI